MSRQEQEPLVKQFAECAKRQGAAVYCGRWFAVAQFPDGRRTDIVIDPRTPRGNKSCQ